MSSTGGTGAGGTILSVPPLFRGQATRDIAFTPAVRGYPGGIDDMAPDQDDYPADEAGDGAAGPDGGEAGPGSASGLSVGGLSAGSVWQQSLAAWQEAGIDWLREAPGEPTSAGHLLTAADDGHTEPIPVVPAAGPPGQAGTDEAAGNVAGGGAAVGGTTGSAGDIGEIGAAGKVGGARAEASGAGVTGGQTDRVRRNGAETDGAEANGARTGSARTGGTTGSAKAGVAGTDRAKAAGAQPGRAGESVAQTSPREGSGAQSGRAGAGGSKAGAGAGVAKAGGVSAGAGTGGVKAGAGTGGVKAGAGTGGVKAGAGTRGAGAGGAKAGGRDGSGGFSRRAGIIAGVTALVVAAGTVTGIVVARSGGRGGAGFGPETPYPPAALADGDFTAPAGRPAMLPELAGIASAGATVVAVGSQGGPALPMPLILVSQDGGNTWARAQLGHTAIAPGPGAVPEFAVRGRAGWLALGQGPAWTSVDGSSWRPAPGLPMAAGDRILGLARTHLGFAAVGENLPGPAGSGVPSPVLWISPDGRAWQRKSGAALSLGEGGLDANGGTVVSLRWAAYRGGVVIVGGEISRPMVRHRGRRKIIVGVESPGLWRSTDDGSTWSPVTLPVSNGAAAGLAGLAATGPAFVAIRPGRTRAGRKAAVAYTSAAGVVWRYAGRLTGGRRAPLNVTLVSGSPQGAVVSGSTGTSRVAFVSAQGHLWHKAADQGRAATTAVTAVTAASGAAVLAVGTRVRPGSRTPGPNPYILLAGAGSGATAGRTQVALRVLAAATTPAVAVNSLAATATEQVAAGTAGGAPALWWAPAGGHWSPGVIAAAGTGAPGTGTATGITSVVHGEAGWLAIGGAGPPAQAFPPPGPGATPAAPGAMPAGPVVMTSPDGRAWYPVKGAGPLGAPGTELSQAAAGLAGYAVVGSQPGPGGTPQSAAWFSADLRTWTPGSVGAAAAGRMLAVTAAGSGFVAVGAAGRVPAVWTSATGAAWRPIALPLPPGAASGVLTSVTALAGRVVATGTASRTAAGGRDAGRDVTGPAGRFPFAAVSADGGRHWREAALPAGPRPGASTSAVTALTAVGGGFAAIGTSTVAGNQGLTGWWSRDGIGWQHEPVTGRDAVGSVREIMALSARGRVLTGAGYAVTASGEHPLLWRARFR